MAIKSINEILPKLDLNVTNRCNFRCTHCAFDSGLIKIPELSLKEIKKILKETEKLGGQRIDITGGEATLRKDIFKILKITKRLNYQAELVTNGSLITKEILEKLKKIGLDSIAISLDGSDYEKYKKIRKTNYRTYKKVLQTINNALEIGLKTKINTTVFESNYKDIPKITKWCIKSGINEHGLYYFTPVGRGNRSSEKAVEPLKWLKFIRKKMKPFRKEKIKISLELPLIEKKFWDKSLGCIANTSRSHLQILPDGNVYPCAILASYYRPISNLKNTSIKRIWKNKKLWAAYWKKIKRIFKDQKGYCVNFKDAFNIKNYPSKKYGFVCQLRKFSLQEIP